MVRTISQLNRKNRRVNTVKTEMENSMKRMLICLGGMSAVMAMGCVSLPNIPSVASCILGVGTGTGAVSLGLAILRALGAAV